MKYKTTIIKIIASCYFEGRKNQSNLTTEEIIEKTSSGNELEEKDLDTILKRLITMVAKIKVQGSSEEYIVEIENSYEIIDKNNNIIDSFDEYTLFDEAVKYDSLSQSILEYCNITEGGRDGRIWMDSETPAGTYAILSLAMHDKKWIPNYIDFLRTCDLDHEVEQSAEIQEVIERYGWCEETCRLAIARMVSCCGQHGDEQFKELLINGLNDYLTIKENRAMFFKNVILEFKEATLLEYSYHHSILDASKGRFLKEIATWVEFFEMVLTEEEMEILKNEVSLIWDRFTLTR